MSYIVISGNPFDGYKYYGPFETFADACVSIERMHPHSWVAKMLPPLKKP
jgi:mannose/fructose/N-acetylgalactosamine-specific phosphotransferase system component IID